MQRTPIRTFLRTSHRAQFVPSPSSPPRAPRSGYPTSFVRSISVSSRLFAAEVPRDPFQSPTSYAEADAAIPLFERLQNHPEAMAAIDELSQLAKEKTGVDLTSGQKPTMAMMLALARDPELQAAATKLMAALQNAGINIDPNQALQALKAMGGEGFEGSNGLPGGFKPKWDGEGEGEGDGKGKA